MLGPRRCAFVGTDGRICGERRFLELDHKRPRALGGSDEPSNLRWLCRAHNLFEAERLLGPDRVDRERHRRRVEREVASALSNLGFSRSESRKAARVAASRVETLEADAVLRAALGELRSSKEAEVA